MTRKTSHGIFHCYACRHGSARLNILRSRRGWMGSSTDIHGNINIYRYIERFRILIPCPDCHAMQGPALGRSCMSCFVMQSIFCILRMSGVAAQDMVCIPHVSYFTARDTFYIRCPLLGPSILKLYRCFCELTSNGIKLTSNRIKLTAN